ncbi:hypothetical protein FO519_006944 [Halicephalobus sp. NKZ332]|nr:hypothetical protein FO519_006944 [Halicephalobus sp. NKZ332]
MSSNEREPSQEPTLADNPEPMEEDATETVPPPQEASSAQAGPSVGRMIFQKLFGDKHSEQKVPMTFSERLEDLENREIYGMGLSPADEYVELLLMDLITGKKNYVHTLHRGQQRWNNDSTLKALTPVCTFVSNFEIGSAIRQLRTVKLRSEKLSKLSLELENRLISLNLILISRCYTSLKPDYLSQLLEISVLEDFQKILTGCEWPIVDGKVQISFNDSLSKYIFGKLINPEMGPFELVQKCLPGTKNETKNSLEKIKDLMSMSDQMMKVTLPPSASNDDSNKEKERSSEEYPSVQ